MKRLALILALSLPMFGPVPMSVLARTNLSSSSLGWFFTLPPDYPTAVSSYDTPGSCDWYVQNTNGDYVARSPRLVPSILSGLNSTFEAYYERLYYGSQGSDNSWDSAIYGPTRRRDFSWKLEPLLGPWTIYRRIDPLHYSGYEDVTDSVRQPEYSAPDYESGLWNAYVAADDEAEPGFRISGLEYPLSKYTTYLSWYANWTNEYSTISRFYESRRAITNSVPDYAALRNFNYNPMTHKVSRRLLDFDNYTSLWQNLQTWASEYYSRNSDAKSFIYRPGWLNSGSGAAYWSTTAITNHHYFADFPDFEWVENPTEKFNDPSYTAPTFANFDKDSIYKTDDRPRDTLSIPLSIFYKIYVENPVWSYEDFPYGSSFGYIPDLLDSLFPEHGDHWYFGPNAFSRRLYFDEICAYNQYLSLFDRTYDIPQFNGFEKYLSTSRHHEKTEVASVSALAHRATDGTWVAEIAPEYLSWGAGTERTYSSSSTNSYGQARMATRIDRSQTSGSVGIEASGNAGTIYYPDIASDLDAPIDAELAHITSAGLGEYGVVVSVTFYKGEMEVIESVERTLGDAGVWDHATITGTGTTTIDRYFYKDWTPLMLGDEFNYSLGPHAPGPEAYQTQRIKDAKTWFVEAHHKYNYTNQWARSISNPLEYSTGNLSHLRYRSVAADVTHQDVNLALNDELESLAATLAEDDPELPINDSWFDEVRSNRYSVGETCGAAALLLNTDETTSGIQGDGIWLDIHNRQITDAFYYDPITGEMVGIDPTTPIISIAVHYSYTAGGSPYPGSVTESTPKNADAYIQPLTRVDWNWKALKRSSTSN